MLALRLYLMLTLEQLPLNLADRAQTAGSGGMHMRQRGLSDKARVAAITSACFLVLNGEASAVTTVSYSFGGSEPIRAEFDVIGGLYASIEFRGGGTLPPAVRPGPQGSGWQTGAGLPGERADYDWFMSLSDEGQLATADFRATNWFVGNLGPMHQGSGMILPGGNSIALMTIQGSTHNVTGFSYTGVVRFVADAVTIRVAPVPGPVSGAGFPALAVFGAWLVRRRYRSQPSSSRKLGGPVQA